MIGKLWAVFFLLSFVFGLLTGRMPAVSQASTSGAAEAVQLILSITGTMMLWSGMMELVRRSGLSARLQGLFKPLLRLLFGRVSRDEQAMELVSANVTANLLGLSNAATPIGLAAARRLHEVEGERSTDGVLTLIVLNTASIQLIPTTVAALRAGMGAASPFDIMPAVWVASILSVIAVLTAARLLRRVL